MGKRRKKGRGRADSGYGTVPPQGWPGMEAAMDGMAPGAGGYGAGYGPGHGADHGAAAGLLGGLPAFLRTRNTEQFLLGLAVGAGAAWALSDDKRRKALVKAAMKFYGGIAGGWEELKEQFADLRAEVDAEQHADA